MYPQSMFWSKNKKNWYTPSYLNCNLKKGFEGYIHHGHVFLMDCHFQRRQTDVQQKLFKLVIGFSAVNQKQRNIKSRIKRLNQKISGLLSLVDKFKLSSHLQGIKDSLQGVKQKVDKLTKIKVCQVSL